MIKFVILSNARSGTSLLSETLNTHPQIVCHGEIFHPDLQWHLKGKLADLLPEEKIALRKNMDDFVEQIFDQPGRDAVGFKMWLDQSPDWCQKFLEDKNVHKIIYERSNKLAQFSSGQLANITNVWNLGLGQTNTVLDAQKLEFDEEGFDDFLCHQSRTFAYYRDVVSGPELQVCYKEIAAGGFSSVLRFLGVDNIELVAQKRKMYSSNILDRFKLEHHEKIVRRLKKMGQEHWIEE